MLRIENFGVKYSEVIGQTVFSVKNITPLPLLAEVCVPLQSIGVVIGFVVHRNEICEAKLIDYFFNAAAQLKISARIKAQIDFRFNETKIALIAAIARLRDLRGLIQKRCLERKGRRERPVMNSEGLITYFFYRRIRITHGLRNKAADSGRGRSIVDDTAKC